MTLTHKELVELLKYIEESRCEEFRLQMDGVDLILRRNVSGVPRSPGRERERSQPTSSKAAEAQRQPAVEQAAYATEPPRAAAGGHDGETVMAPMAGTFYRRPSPDAPTYVEVGDRVQKGDPLCMIEVMKLFSTIYAEVAGKVVAIEVGDGEAVEQGQPLLVIDPAG